MFNWLFCGGGFVNKKQRLDLAALENAIGEVKKGGSVQLLLVKKKAKKK